jgi:3-oxoacyl-[acyl-carrier-protein] synthase II
LGEGAGILVLEEYIHAKNRNAKIYAEVCGYGVSADANHTTSPPSDGEGAFRSMQNALRNSGLNASQINYINAHATSTPLGDSAELIAINRLFPTSTRVSSTKGALGHLLGASGAVDAIFTILSLQKGIIPPTLNLHNIYPHNLDVNCVPLVAQEVQNMMFALTNSFGFGGTNVSLILQKI